MSANSILSVDAGGSRQWALCEASTSPLSASATIQERPLRSLGRTGTPGPRLTWVPAFPSRAPPTVDMEAGGFGCFLPPLSSWVSAHAGAMARAGNNAAAVTVNAVFFRADTDENVQGLEENMLISPMTRREVPRDSPPWAIPAPRPPRRTRPEGSGDTEYMKLSRPVSWFLLAFGVWSWFIWITFVKNLWKDGSGLAFDDAGDPTGYFWVHLLLAITSFLLGTAVGGIGLRGVRALRHAANNE